MIQDTIPRPQAFPGQNAQCAKIKLQHLSASPRGQTYRMRMNPHSKLRLCIPFLTTFSSPDPPPHWLPHPAQTPSINILIALYIHVVSCSGTSGSLSRSVESDGFRDLVGRKKWSEMRHNAWKKKAYYPMNQQCFCMFLCNFLSSNFPCHAIWTTGQPPWRHLQQGHA